MFDFGTFDCVRLATFLGEFDKVRLGSINERSIDCAGHLPFRIFYYFKIKTKKFKRQIRRLQEHAAKGVISLNLVL